MMNKEHLRKKIVDRISGGGSSEKTCNEVAQYKDGLRVLEYMEAQGLSGETLWEYCRSEFLDNTLDMYLIWKERWMAR